MSSKYADGVTGRVEFNEDGDLGNDKDCVSELSRVRNEKPGAFTHNHPFVVG